jgi:hypothetical protein
MSQVYTPFTVLKCNLVHITSQTKDKIHNHTQTAALRRSPIWEDPVHGIILTLGNPQDLYKLIYTHFILLYFIFLYLNSTSILTKIAVK